MHGHKAQKSTGYIVFKQFYFLSLCFFDKIAFHEEKWECVRIRISFLGMYKKQKERIK